MSAKTCRDEVLEAVRVIVRENGKKEFTVKEVIAYLTEKGTSYKESTIRTHIQSKCCRNSPKNHGTIYNDYERIRSGIYILIA
jgi:hypothetical protein